MEAAIAVIHHVEEGYVEEKSNTARIEEEWDKADPLSKYAKIGKHKVKPVILVHIPEYATL